MSSSSSLSVDHCSPACACSSFHMHQMGTNTFVTTGHFLLHTQTHLSNTYDVGLTGVNAGNFCRVTTLYVPDDTIEKQRKNHSRQKSNAALPLSVVVVVDISRFWRFSVTDIPNTGGGSSSGSVRLFGVVVSVRS